MPLPHSDVLECLTGCSDRVPAPGAGDGGSEAARERALNSAVASGRLRGRSSCFPVGSVVEGQPGGKSADADPVLFGNDLTARPLRFPSAARHRRMARTPAHWPVYCARFSFGAARSE